VSARLVEQRSFRVQQLEDLVDRGDDRALGAGPAEVRHALRAAAEAALADVDAALRRIEQGTYGRCASCAGMVSRARLEAVPSAPLCGTCHHALDMLGPS
jgi:RNA polymerase-binding transcription factor DksA